MHSAPVMKVFVAPAIVFLFLIVSPRGYGATADDVAAITQSSDLDIKIEALRRVQEKFGRVIADFLVKDVLSKGPSSGDCQIHKDKSVVTSYQGAGLIPPRGEPDAQVLVVEGQLGSSWIKTRVRVDSLRVTSMMDDRARGKRKITFGTVNDTSAGEQGGGPATEDRLTLELDADAKGNSLAWIEGRGKDFGAHPTRTSGRYKCVFFGQK